MMISRRRREAFSAEFIAAVLASYEADRAHTLAAMTDDLREAVIAAYCQIAVDTADNPYEVYL